MKSKRETLFVFSGVHWLHPQVAPPVLVFSWKLDFHIFLVGTVLAALNDGHCGRGRSLYFRFISSSKEHPLGLSRVRKNHLPYWRQTCVYLIIIGLSQLSKVAPVREAAGTRWRLGRSTATLPCSHMATTSASHLLLFQTVANTCSHFWQLLTILLLLGNTCSHIG